MERHDHLGARGTAENAGSWLLIDPGIEFPLFNMAIAAGKRTDMPGQATIGFAAAWFRDRGLKQFRLVLRERADAALIDAAQELGLAEGSAPLPSMALRPLEAPLRWRPQACGSLRWAMKRDSSSTQSSSAGRTRRGLR